MASWGKEQEAEIEATLKKLGVGEEIVAKFKAEKIYASTVKLLGDQDLEELGLRRMGDRVMLRELCAEAVKTKTVSQEVRSILSPLPFSARLGSSASGSSMIDRRPKRKGKAKLAAEKYAASFKGSAPKGRRPAQTFQKKFVVIDYMGESAPRSFALKEVHVLMRGMLPEIAVTASEEEVRASTCDTIKNSEETLIGWPPSGFEFLEASGKCLCVPAQQAGFEWTGRAVKGLAGTGAVYVRLTAERDEEGEESSSSDSSEESPRVKVKKGGNTESCADWRAVGSGSRQSQLLSQPSRGFGLPPRSRLSLVQTSAASTSASSRLSLPPTLDRSSAANGPSTVSNRSHAANPVSSVSSAPGPSWRVMDDVNVENPAQTMVLNRSPCDLFDVVASRDNMIFLAGALPQVPIEQLKFLLEIHDDSVDRATNFYLEGFSMTSLVEAMKSCLVNEDDARHIEVESLEDPEQLASAALQFYSDDKFSPCAEVLIDVLGESEQVLDGGGVRRQFLSDVLAAFITSRTVQLFEGPPNRVRPIFKQSSVSSGMLRTAGKIIGHSILLDCQGFPFLSPACYYYMAGHTDKATAVVSMEDAGGRVGHVIGNLMKVSSDEQLQQLPVLDELMDLMEQSGCDRPLKVASVHAICDDLLYYNVLLKMKVFLDALGEGLEVFHLRSAMKAFPDLFEPLFVASGKCSAEDILQILNFQQAPEGTRGRVASFLKSFVRDLSEPELKDFLRAATGSPCHQGNVVNIFFTGDPDQPAFSFGTCGNQLTLSELVESQEEFSVGLKAVMGGRKFTVA